MSKCPEGQTPYRYKNEIRCRKKRVKREDEILKRLDTIISLLRTTGRPMPMGMPPPPPPPPMMKKSNKPKTPNKAALARASMMNNLKRALAKRKKND